MANGNGWGKFGLALIVEFGTNTLSLLVYFYIPVVSNCMWYLGAQTADGRRKTVDSRRQTAGGRQQTADGRWQMADGRR